MTRHPLDVDLDVWAGVEDGLDVVNDLEAKVLSWGGVGFEASSYCCLVVDKDPNGPGVGVVLYPLSGMGGGLLDSKQFCIVDLGVWS